MKFPYFKHRPTHGGNSGVKDCSCWGLTYEQFMDFLALCKTSKKWRELKRKGVASGRTYASGHPKAGQQIPRGGYISAHDLVGTFVKPLTKGTDCGLGLLLNHSPRPCDMMLSHSWNEDMYVVFVLELTFNKHNLTISQGRSRECSHGILYPEATR